ncbi:ABC transporter permease [Ligilactobacillus equi]|uniref:Abc transporter, permease protein n=1 Tax=Ligilactobacillus equi DSM 15833 = JCM 10991 TaxID=1423740 RepID=A0A0R1TPL6_9LACO|nr:ABC transporter permease [Ligilactobacillus equi]KRL83303.1 abc transporter, permease protein [Ligilactobacillus equi DSM 15833 = JCM 10991]
MKKLMIVARETYVRQVKSWAFVLLLLSPFIFFGISLGIGYFIGHQEATNQRIAVITNDRELRQSLKKDKQLTLAYTKVAKADQALTAQKIAGYVVIDNQADQRLVATYQGVKTLDTELKQKLTTVLNQRQLALNYARVGLTVEEQKQLQQVPVFNEKIDSEYNNKETVKLLSVMILIILMYFILLNYSATTAQEIAAEKGTKIMEVIFSSIPAKTYFYGKILGLFGVIFTQVSIYLLGGGILYSFLPKLGEKFNWLKTNQSLITDVIQNLLSVSLLYVVLGVVLYTILSAFCGALVVRVEDSNKAVQPLMYLIMGGFFGVMALAAYPENIIVRVLSYVPFLSSFFMPLRLIDGSVGGGQVLISLSLLLMTIFLLANYIAKIYFGLILQNDDISLWRSFKKALTIK